MKKHHVYKLDRGYEEDIAYLDKEEYERLKEQGVDEDRLSHTWYYDKDDVDKLIAEEKKLRSEVEKLRADAEKSSKAYTFLVKSFERNIVAMQAAVIEWEHGRGAEAGMQWIFNTLAGPGLLPDGKDAQAYFDANAPDLVFDAPNAAMQETK